MPLRAINNGRSEQENRHHFILVHAWELFPENTKGVDW
jgi:hypothetical protein